MRSFHDEQYCIIFLPFACYIYVYIFLKLIWNVRDVRYFQSDYDVIINLLICFAKHSVVLGKVSTEKTIQTFVGLFSQVRFIPVKRKGRKT